MTAACVMAVNVTAMDSSAAVVMTVDVTAADLTLDGGGRIFFSHGIPDIVPDLEQQSWPRGKGSQ